MPEQAGFLSRFRPRSLLALAALGTAMATVVVAGVLAQVSMSVAIDATLAFALLGALGYAAVDSGYGKRWSDSRFVEIQLVVAYLVLAWLTFRAGDTRLPVTALYVFAMLYGLFLLERQQLAVLAAIALVSHGVALFMLIDHGGKISVSGAWLQVFALLFSFAWLIYAAGFLQRLRVRLADARKHLYELEREANERAGRDVLTGTYHQQHLLEALEREIARADRVGKPLSIARVDLDHLGSLNGAFGRIAGDVALRRFTAASTEALRDVDVLGRYGGKEFLVIMPDTALKGAVIAAERVRASVGREPVPEVEGRRHLSCTLGVAEHRKGENTRLLIGRAEAGLAYGKAAGRDRVVALDADGKPMIVEAA
jgi:diguanylate cyclase (GGDEF)-like protein